jgi:hypothetical protein
VIKPAVAFPPAIPFTPQVTLVFVLPVTVAMYCDEVPRVTLLEPISVTVTADSWAGLCGGAASAIGRLLETEGLATLVAVIVTFGD